MSKRKKTYILADAPKVINRLEYQKVKKPLIVKGVGIEPKKVYAILYSLLLQGYTIYTDCINQPSITSRATLITKGGLKWDKLAGYKTTTTDSVLKLEWKV